LPAVEPSVVSTLANSSGSSVVVASLTITNLESYGVDV